MCINNLALFSQRNKCAKLLHTHNIKALVSGEEFWAQIMIGCGGLAAAWEPGGEKQPQMANTLTEKAQRQYPH